MKIAFCLPGATKVSSGGYLVIYKYANFLAEKGHEVAVLYGNYNLRGMSFFYAIKPLRKAIVYHNFGRRPKWFELDKRINVRYLWDGYTEENLCFYDVVIATSVNTPTDIDRLKIKAKKYYFVQDFEAWGYSAEYVIETYKLKSLRFIVVSSWLRNIIKNYSKNSIYLVPNGIDLDKMYLSVPIENRNPKTVAMLYHQGKHKGSQYGIEALLQLKEIYPELIVNIFGVYPRPENLPEWFHYTQKASHDELREIYNSSSIFLCPTLAEGFGLTGLESMACGCAFVSTDYEAVHEYAVHEENSLLCAIKDSNALYLNMERLIKDNELRIRLAENGVNKAQEFSFEQASERFEKILYE